MRWLGGALVSSAGPRRGSGDRLGRTWSCVDAGGPLCALAARRACRRGLGSTEEQPPTLRRPCPGGSERGRFSSPAHFCRSHYPCVGATNADCARWLAAPPRERGLSIPTVPVPRLLSRPLAPLRVRAESSTRPRAHCAAGGAPGAALHSCWGPRAWKIPACRQGTSRAASSANSSRRGCLSVPSAVLHFSSCAGTRWASPASHRLSVAPVEGLSVGFDGRRRAFPELLCGWGCVGRRAGVGATKLPFGEARSLRALPPPPSFRLYRYSVVGS